MVIEDYCPFLTSVIYLQDLGLLSYSRHRPLERVNWASPFWAGTRDQAALLVLSLFWGPVDGRLFSNPISYDLVGISFVLHLYIISFKCESKVSHRLETQRMMN